MTVKQKVLRLVDAVPTGRLREVERFLENLLVDPLLVALANAPDHDEPCTEEEQRADENARECYRGGEGIPREALAPRA